MHIKSVKRIFETVEVLLLTFRTCFGGLIHLMIDNNSVFKQIRLELQFGLRNQK